MSEPVMNTKVQKHAQNTHCFLRIHIHLGKTWERINAHRPDQKTIKLHTRTKENILTIRDALTTAVKEIDKKFPEIKEQSKNDIGCVYIIRAGGTDYYKIGYTSRAINQRMSELQGSNPLPLSLVALWKSEQKAEKELHHLFSSYRTKGEWFELSAAEVLSAISGITSLLD